MRATGHLSLGNRICPRKTEARKGKEYAELLHSVLVEFSSVATGPVIRFYQTGLLQVHCRNVHGKSTDR